MRCTQQTLRAEAEEQVVEQMEVEVQLSEQELPGKPVVRVAVFIQMVKTAWLWLMQELVEKPF
jgi:hypothetical protein